MESAWYGAVTVGTFLSAELGRDAYTTGGTGVQHLRRVNGEGRVISGTTETSAVTGSCECIGGSQQTAE